MMKKHHSILAAWVTSGLFCGIATVTLLADDITPTPGIARQTAEFDRVSASRIGAAGQLLGPAAAAAAQARSASTPTDGQNQVLPARSFSRLAETAPRDSRNARVTRQGDASARGLNVSWTMKVSRISKLGDTNRQPGSFARSVTVEPERAVGNTLRQAPFQPRAID